MKEFINDQYWASSVNEYLFKEPNKMYPTDYDNSFNLQLILILTTIFGTLRMSMF